jgi:hypothetical protein
MSEIKSRVNVSYSFNLAFILSKLDIDISDADSTLTHVSYGVLLLSLIALLCFINIIGYMIVYVILQKGNYEEKLKG